MSINDQHVRDQAVFLCQRFGAAALPQVDALAALCEFEGDLASTEHLAAVRHALLSLC